MWDSWYGHSEDRKETYEIGLCFEDNTAECCAIANVTCFPVDSEIEGANKDKWIDSLRKELRQCVSSAREENCSMLFASVNTDQLEAEKVLIEMGFVCPFDGWAYRNPKRLHEGSTGVKHYTKALFQIRKRVRKAKR